MTKRRNKPTPKQKARPQAANPTAVSKVQPGLELMRAQERTNSWVNATTGLGTTRDKTHGNRPDLVVPLTESDLENLYTGDNLAATIVNSIPEDAFSKGFEITGGQDPARLYDLFENLCGVAKFVEAWKWGRLHGGSALFLGIKDFDQSKPLDPLSHGRLLYTMVLDRWELQPNTYYTDANSPKYLQVQTYRVQPRSFQSVQTEGENRLKYGTIVHESRLLMFGGASTSKNWKLYRNSGWDASVLQAAYDPLRAYAGLWQNVDYAVSDMSQGVFKIKDIATIIANGQKDQILNRMEVLDMARSVARSVVVDADNEDFTTVGSQNLGSVAPILTEAASRVASAASMPLTRLMGTSPGGLNATGESDLSWWYGVIDVARETVAYPKLLKLLQVISRSYGLHTTDLAVEFPALWSLSDLEVADLQGKDAGTDKQYLDMGVLTREEIRALRFPELPPLATAVAPAAEGAVV